MVKDIDTQKVCEIIRHVAATEIMPRFQNLAAGEIREKNPGDFVTVADEASEHALSELLRDILPGAVYVGEEAVAKNIKVLDVLKEDRPVWVIDPIDGTYNFSHNRSRFGVLLALVYRGETIYGFAYDVPGQRMALAEKGAGAVFQDQKIAIDQADKPLSAMSCRGGGAQAWHFEPVHHLFRELINYRCSLHDFMDFYTGEADCVVHLTRTTPWDHAANVLISEEAGGAVRIAGTEKFDPAHYGPAYLTAAGSADLCRILYEQTEPFLKRSRQRKELPV